jgi:hypothetical protein
MLVMSDIHFGKKTMTYNPEVFEKRLSEASKRLRRIRTLLGDYKFDELVVCVLGDTVDGAGIYPTQFHHQDLTNADEQAEVLSKLLAKFGKEQQDAWGKLRFECVPGNHGRSGAFNSEAQNYDLTTYKYLELRLEEAGIPVLYNKTGDLFIRRITVRGHRYLAFHGHSIRLFQQIPWYGITQRVMRWHNSSLAPFDTVLMGHFHTCQMVTANKVRIFLTGTPVTDDEWALQILGMEGSPRWWLVGISDHHPITWQFTVDLA